ncbi:MAG TPA: serine/threonine-protein kinase [Thermoanaerobaculia bacterium]|nr:serine/threonine-protein kinase [Thermoanaerobaculia bacterium]
MTPDRWEEVKAVLEQALERDPADRASFLSTACRADQGLRDEVESLLATDVEAGDFLSEPVFGPYRGEPYGLEEGARLGSYRVLREIGRGGMGSVYLAVRVDDYEKQVAIKVMGLGTAAEIVRRFRAERQILANLGHPGIAKLLDGGTTENGLPYLVMEHVEGRPIDVHCSGLPLPERLELFCDVCAAVHFAHQNLVVHRDLKPANILVTPEGAPKLLDFGIAKLLDPERYDPAFTEIGLRPMTLDFASPEQVRGEPITTASDVYSLGVLLYRLLTGRSPYTAAAGDREGLSLAVRELEPPRPSDVVDGKEESRRLAGDLDTIVLRAMGKEPGRRYASAEQLAADVRRHLDGLPVLARPDTLIYRTGKLVRRHPVGVTASAAALLMILGFSIAMTVLYRKAVEERERTEQERARAESVSDFLQDLFAIPNPSVSRGEAITAREVLDRGAARIVKDLGDQPELQAELMDTMGRAYRDLGLYTPGRDLLERSLAIRRATLDGDDPRIAESLNALAFLLRKMGNDADAEPLVREAVDIQLRVFGEEHPETLISLNNLASLLEAKGELGPAEALYRRILEVKRRSLGREHKDVARGLNNLAHLLYVKGDLAEAEPLYREALAIRRKVYGGGPHPEVASSLNNLAALLADQGDDSGAEALYRKALDMRRALYHEPHLDVARNCNNLALLLQSRGDFAAAEPLYREALAIAEAIPDLGRHPDRAVFFRNYASLLVETGRAAAAEPLAREAVAIFREGHPPSALRIADAESVLGGCLAALGRVTEAEPLLRGSWEVLKDAQGESARYREEAQRRLAALETARKRG